MMSVARILETPEDLTPALTHDELAREYADWCRANSLSLGSAEEHLFDEDLTDAQCQWLWQFLARWEFVSRLERRHVS
jgi:hypothetical protein